MAKQYHVLDTELKNLVQQVCRQFMSSHQPRPLAPRRELPSGGGGARLDATFAVVTESIGPASGTTDEITPGTGMVQFYETDDEGVRTPTEGDPVEVRNYDPDQTYAVNSMVYTTGTDEGSEVICGSCGTFDEPEE